MGRLYWQDNTRTLYNASCTDMRELANESIQAVITSPPFWGLRKYAGEQSLIWGGDPNCGHTKTEPSPLPSVPKAGNKQRDYIEDGRYIGKHRWQHGKSSLKKSNQGVGSNYIKLTDKKDKLNKQTDIDPGSAFCLNCGAWKGSLGLEPEPDCGRPYLKLKDNLTDKQREYVMSELERLGLSNER